MRNLIEQTNGRNLLLLRKTYFKTIIFEQPVFPIESSEVTWRNSGGL